MFLRSGITVLLFVAACAIAPAATMSVQVAPDTPSAAPVGTMVSWTATVGDGNPGTLWYRFRVRRSGGDFRTIRDYAPGNVVNWTAGDYEGPCDLEVSARNLDTGEEASAVASYVFTSRVEDGTPVVSPTANPLVFLYSAPPCPDGSRMQVQFQSADGYTQSTDYRPCAAGVSMNFYLAGMRAETSYNVQHTIDNGEALTAGPALTLTTGPVSLNLAPYTVLTAAPATTTEGILLQSSLAQTIVATDLSGGVLWYYANVVSDLTDAEPGGLFLGVTWNGTLDSSQQILREFDLAGVTMRETNAARVAEQLVAMGKRPITSFHHDARALPDGRILALASVEQILTDVQGPGPVDVVGDMILVLDQNLQVEWAWDAFDHLDPARRAILNETCAVGGGGCAPFYLANTSNDWLHGNSVSLTPDGNILYSVRHQDWLLKIDYSNGAGSGDVLWRLGKDGDFTIDSGDPYPWFSHQHDANFLPGDNSTIVLFDNGNTRRTFDPQGHSRGQVIRIDEENRTASFVLNADLGANSIALGSARLLKNGDFHFDVGWIQGATGQPDTSRTVEVDPAGNIVYDLKADTQEYRTFRMRDLYTP